MAICEVPLPDIRPLLCHRYAILSEWLEFRGRNYTHAGFLDVGDAYFQRDPFKRIRCHGMTVFTETAAIKLAARENIHRDHYKHHCSTGFDQMRHLPPINSGAYFGDRRSFLATMQACQRKIAKCGMGYDQGTFTEVLYNETPPSDVGVYTTEHGPVASVALSRTLQVDLSGDVLNEAGEAYAIVHQFDRFDSLRAHHQRRWPIDVTKAPINLDGAALRRYVAHDTESTTDPFVGRR